MPSVGEMRTLWDSSVEERRQSLDAALPRLAERALNEGARLVMIKAGTSGIYLRAGAQPLRGRGAPGGGAWSARELWAPGVGTRM